MMTHQRIDIKSTHLENQSKQPGYERSFHRHHDGTSTAGKARPCIAFSKRTKKVFLQPSSPSQSFTVNVECVAMSHKESREWNRPNMLWKLQMLITLLMQNGEVLIVIQLPFS